MNVSDTAARLKDAADDQREKLSSTLGELRDRLAPGQIADEALSFARQNGDAMLSNLSTQARGNPVAFFLIGTGVALLLRSSFRNDGYRGGMSMYRDDEAGDLMRRTADPTASFGYDDDEGAGRRALPRLSEAAESFGDSVKSSVSDAGERLSSQAADVRDRVNEGLSSVRETYASATDAVSQQAGQLRDRAIDVYSEAYDRAGDYTGRARSGLSTLASEQPLVLGALGLLAGAALAAMLPRTKVEDEYMGSTAQRLRTEARHTAEETYERAKSAAAKAAEKAAEVVSEEFAGATSSEKSAAKDTGATGGPSGSVSSTGGTSPIGTAAKGISAGGGGARPTESISATPDTSRTR